MLGVVAARTVTGGVSGLGARAAGAASAAGLVVVAPLVPAVDRVGAAPPPAGAAGGPPGASPVAGRAGSAHPIRTSPAATTSGPTTPATRLMASSCGTPYRSHSSTRPTQHALVQSSACRPLLGSPI